MKRFRFHPSDRPWPNLLGAGALATLSVGVTIGCFVSLPDLPSIGIMTSVLSTLPVYTFGAALYDMMTPAHVGVGVDGLALRGTPGVSFVPWSEVREVEVLRDWVMVRRRRGASVPLRAIEDVSAFIAACEEARASFDARDVSEVPASFRNDEETGYRAPSLPAGALVRIASNPKVELEVRVTAAAQAVAAGGRADIVDVIEETADPRVRRMLEKSL